MRSRVFFLLSVVVLACASVVATGCNQDTLNSGSQGLNMAYTPSPSGSGRFDPASFQVNRIQVVPTDPQAAAVFGAERLLLRYTPFEANLVATQPVSFSNIALAAGTYRVTFIEFSPLALVDSNLTTNPATCIDGVSVIDGSQPPGVPLKFSFNDPPDDLSGLNFTVQPGQTSLALTVDVPGLIAGYEAAYTCTFVPCPGCPVNPRPTLTAFSTAAYRNALLANITIK